MMQDYWNMFDFAMVALSLLSVALDFADSDGRLPGLQELRILRVMRLLRLVPKMTGIRCAIRRQAGCAQPRDLQRQCWPAPPPPLARMQILNAYPAPAHLPPPPRPCFPLTYTHACPLTHPRPHSHPHPTPPCLSHRTGASCRR
jgi:hypothetical protein